MADTKISALTALTGAGTDATADVLPIVDTSATATKKIVVNQLAIAMAATQNDIDTGTNTSTLINPSLNRITLSTEQATTSGTAIDFTGIPSGTRKIRIMLAGVSTNGSSRVMVQIGDSGGIETAGYLAGAAGITGGGAVNAANSFTVGFPFDPGAAGSASEVRSGFMTLTLEDSSDNTWTESMTMYDSGSGFVAFGGGSKATSAVLDRIRLTTENGTDAFDAGVVNIQYER